MRLGRRTALISGLGAALAGSGPARAGDAVSVGVLRFVSSGGLFLAQEMGFFKQAGIAAQFVYFDAAQPVAVALASGDAGFGATAITGGTLNLAAKGVLKVVASQGAERKGFKGSALLVSRAAYDRGVTSLAKLPGASVAITQIGSSQHYMLGQIAAAEGFDIKALTIRPLQSIANMIATIRSGQVDATILTPQFARALLERGEVHLLAYLSDVADYQYGALFASAKLAAGSPELTRRFVAAYRQGAAAYADALLRRDTNGDFIADDRARAAASRTFEGRRRGPPSAGATARRAAPRAGPDGGGIAPIGLNGRAVRPLDRPGCRGASRPRRGRSLPSGITDRPTAPRKGRIAVASDLSET